MVSKGQSGDQLVKFFSILANNPVCAQILAAKNPQTPTIWPLRPRSVCG
jgi:hypothetical protein